MSAPTDPWFPRPSAPTGILVLGASGELGPVEIFDLLWSRDALEWRDKVGVSSPAEGSAKSSTRLLCSHGWVFKTDTGLASATLEAPRLRAAELVAVANRVELWHPDKRWFLLRSPAGPDDRDERWWPVSVCPQMSTMRSIEAWQSFSERWAEVIGFALERSASEGLGLDLGPANFGFTSPGARVWYLDDELYPPLDLGDIAQAIVNRIPEWPDVDAEAWRHFGLYLRGLLEPLQLQPRRWVELREHVGDIALASRWAEPRAELLLGLGRPRRPAVSSGVWPRQLPQRTAVISDVHANLAALDAVIADATNAGVDSWLLLGDVVGYGPEPGACFERLLGLPQLIGVRGNHDHMACFGVTRDVNELARASLLHAREHLDQHQREFLMSLPVELRGEGWLAVHGAPIDPQRFCAYIYDLNLRANLDHLLASPRPLCFYGHTHLAAAIHLAEPGGTIELLEPHGTIELRRPGALLVNPGSVGQPRDGDVRASYAIWDRRAHQLQFRRVSYDIDRTRAALRGLGLPEALGARLMLGR